LKKENKAMPELPEVETIRRILEPQIKDSVITSVTVNRPEIVAHPTADDFCRLLVGQTVSGMTRRGKFLGIELTSGDCVILHLRMTGCLLVTPSDYPQEKHTHVVFHLKNGMELRFSDTRRFGRFWLSREGETDTYSGIDRLGLEPFDNDFNADYLQSHLGKRKKVIKECLLDQSMIAGIGNIYSDEILYAAKIHQSDRRGMGVPCCDYFGEVTLFYRKELPDAGRISGRQGTELSQHTFFAGVRSCG
jgi:formamidopyrimidine-DNA glycosylase